MHFSTSQQPHLHLHRLSSSSSVLAFSATPTPQHKTRKSRKHVLRQQPDPSPKDASSNGYGERQGSDSRYAAHPRASHEQPKANKGLTENVKVAYPFFITNELPRQPNNTDDAYLRNPTFSIVTMGLDTWCTARVIFDAPTGSGYCQQNRKVTFLESAEAATTGEALEKLLKLSEYVLLDAKEDISFTPAEVRTVKTAEGTWLSIT